MKVLHDNWLSAASLRYGEKNKVFPDRYILQLMLERIKEDKKGIKKNHKQTTVPLLLE